MTGNDGPGGTGLHFQHADARRFPDDTLTFVSSASSFKSNGYLI
jgi:hypothetical protein